MISLLLYTVGSHRYSLPAAVSVPFCLSEFLHIKTHIVKKQKFIILGISFYSCVVLVAGSIIDSWYGHQFDRQITSHNLMTVVNLFEYSNIIHFILR